MPKIHKIVSNSKFFLAILWFDVKEHFGRATNKDKQMHLLIITTNDWITLNLNGLKNKVLDLGKSLPS